MDHGLHVVGVHVKDQPLGDLGHVGAVGRRSCVKVVGGEAHLVVHHEVHGATCAVAVQACHLGHLVHHTLARDGRVAVDEDGQHTGFVAAMGVDACTGDAFHHRVHRLEVRGVGRQSDGHLFTGVRHLLARVAEVVLDVAVKKPVVVVGFAFKLAEDVRVGLAQNVGQGAQTTPVRHANHHFLDAARGARLDHRVEGRNQTLPAFKREALLAHKLLLQEFLEQRRLADLLQDVLASLRIQARAVDQLNPVTDPRQAFRLADVHVLDPNRFAVRRFEVRHDVLQRCRPQPHFAARLEHGVQVGLAQVELRQIQGGQVGPAGPNRVRLGEEVSPGAVPMDQIQHLELLQGRWRRGVLAVLGAAQVKSSKKKSPRAVHRFGVLQVTSVHGIERARFGVAQKRKWVHEDRGVLRA